MQRHASSEGAPKKSSKLGKFSLRRSDKEVELLDIGDEAPDFELCDEAGNMHRLSSYRGRRVILSFFRYGECVCVCWCTMYVYIPTLLVVLTSAYQLMYRKIES